MKRYVSTAVIAAAFFVGISLLLYPVISEYINAKHQSKAIASYDETVSHMSEAEYDEIFAKARAYNDALARTEGAFYQPERVPGYLEALDITGTGIMGYVTIDKIGVELPVYHTVETDVLQSAVGHLPGTSLPIGGEGTHAVLSGHRGLPSARLFTDLNKLEPGDLFTITVLNRVVMYRVDQVKIVDPTDVTDLQLIPGRDYCTLFTCTPYGINSHRLLVRGVRVETPEDAAPRYIANEAYRIDPLIVTPAVAAPMLLGIVVVMLIKSRRSALKQKLRREGLLVREKQ
ncbi:class C sortase [uncultured Ruminococcus sp.]|uniref:class C sortase n=1 Tax=uncultured Ruminococcus sp. TaxID=165186 RepID=UPI0025970865|nr:class C sortase [uncultured Ruminococcus sp.]